MFGFSVFDVQLYERKKVRSQHIDEKETEMKALGIILRLLLRSAALLSVSLEIKINYTAYCLEEEKIIQVCGTYLLEEQLLVLVF